MGAGAHPAFTSMGTRCFVSRAKRPESDADRSPLSSAEVRMSGAIPLLPLYALMAFTGTSLLSHFKFIFE